MRVSDVFLRRRRKKEQRSGPPPWKKVITLDTSKKYTVVADKGFAAEEQFKALTEKELSYVILIKRGSKLVASYLPLTPQSYFDLFT